MGERGGGRRDKTIQWVRAELDGKVRDEQKGREELLSA